jgi:hypothetical protein
VAAWTGIPVEALTAADAVRLQRLPETLAVSVVSSYGMATEYYNYRLLCALYVARDRCAVELQPGSCWSSRVLSAAPCTLVLAVQQCSSLLQSSPFLGDCAASVVHWLLLLLQGRVAGQAEAVSAAARALQRAGAGLRDSRRPVATLLFCGPTGVGKTLLAKVPTPVQYSS